MKLFSRLLLLAFLACLNPGDVLATICSRSFCECEDSNVSCVGEGKEVLELSSSSLPSSMSTFSLSNMASVTIKTDTFSGQEELKEFTLEKIENVVMEKFSYSTSELSGHITHVRMQEIKQLQMESGNSLDNFPQCSHVVFKKVGMKVS